MQPPEQPPTKIPIKTANAVTGSSVSVSGMARIKAVEPDRPEERYLLFIDDINSILHRCQMEDIYPVNPYEAFILMCLVTENPMDVYAEVWEKSYEDEM